MEFHALNDVFLGVVPKELHHGLGNHQLVRAYLSEIRSSAKFIEQVGGFLLEAGVVGLRGLVEFEHFLDFSQHLSYFPEPGVLVLLIASNEVGASLQLDYTGQAKEWLLCR